jgi:hypothetical protein
MSEQQFENNYCELVDAISSCGFNYSTWRSLLKTIGGPCEESIKIFVILLISKLEEVSDFDVHSYDRLYSHIIRKFCGNYDNTNPLKYSDVPKLSIDELIEKQILEGARLISRKRFIACLDELRSLDHINDQEGRLDTTTFAQFVNSYFFLNKENFDRFIVNLYTCDCMSYIEYLKFLKE